MKLADKIKAIPMPEPSFTYERHLGGVCEPERVGAYTADGMSAMLESAAALAASHDALMQQMAEALKHCQDWFCAAGFVDTPCAKQLQAALNAYKEQQ